MQVLTDRNAKPRLFPNKFHLGLLVISATVTSLMLFIYFHIRHLNLVAENIEEEEYQFDYEYMGEREELEMIKNRELKILKHKIAQINKNQYIYNYQEQFESFKDSTFVIVIQVHRNTEIMYLDFLLDCLKSAPGISNALLIFAHDSFDEDIYALIHKIQFTKFMQIFYPFSTQFYPQCFPGPDSKLCINDFQCESSMLRFEGFTQKKHFWWWHVNYVFDKLKILQDYGNSILFLESNQYVVNDFIIMYKTMEALQRLKCPECEMLCLGSARNPNGYKFLVYNGNVTVTRWNTVLGSTGFAFNRTVWNNIKNNSVLFCGYNDYRWEVSLRYLGWKRREGQFTVMASVAPRVFSYRECDGHVDCSVERMVGDAQTFIESVSKNLFPQSLKIMRRSRRIQEVEGIYGSWEDDRDKGLCMYMSQ